MSESPSGAFLADIKAYMRQRYGLEIDDWPEFREFVGKVAKEMGFPKGMQITLRHPALLEAVKRRKDNAKQ